MLLFSTFSTTTRSVCLTCDCNATTRSMSQYCHLCSTLTELRLPVQEDSFHLVDNRPTQKNKGQRRFNPQRFAHRNTQFNRGQPEQPHQARQKQQKQRQFQNFHRDNQRVMHYWLQMSGTNSWQTCSRLPTVCNSFTLLLLSWVLSMPAHAATAAAARGTCAPAL